MRLLDTLLYYISVPKCTKCRKRLMKDELALCTECKKEYANLLRRNCSICAKPLYECTCTNEYLDSHFVHKVIKIWRYRAGETNAANSLIFSLKKDNRRDVLKYLSDELASAVLNSIKINDNYIVSSVPRSEKSLVKYGIDQSEELGKALAKILGLKYVKLLKSTAKRQQKHAESREERFKNVEMNVIKRAPDISGKNVILVDDVITTGASMSHAATHIKGLGAKKIIGAALAIAYKDTYVQFESGDRFNTI